MHLRRRGSLLLALLLPAPLAAQAGDTAPFILTLPASTHAQALGGAAVALGDPSVVFHNPAQLLAARGMELSVARYRSVSSLATFATTMSLFGGGVGFGAQRLEYFLSDAAAAGPVGGEAGLTRRAATLATSLTATLGHARTYRGFRIGVSGKYAEQRVPDERASIVAFDVGVSRNVGRGVWVALAAQNLGPRFEIADQRFDLPRRYTLGAAFQGYPLSTWFDLGASVALPVHDDGSILPGAGVELSYVPIDGVVLTGRLGARAVRHRAEFPLTSGLAIGFDNILLEYAFQSYDYPGYAHRVGIRLIPSS